MKIVFLEANTLGEDVDFSGYEELGEVVKYPLSDPARNAERSADADILVLNKIKVNAGLLGESPKCKLVCVTATGTNIVDFNYTNSHGITVCNVKGYSTGSVVQLTFAMALSLMESLGYYDAFVKSGDYARNDVFSHFLREYHEIQGKTWGIIGLGQIGRSVARIAKAFGCRVVYYSTSGKNSNPDYERLELDELLKISDIVSIHAPLNAATNGLVGAAQLALMKRSAIIINLGRGGIIEEQALADAINNGVIAGAGVDVYTTEPMPANHPYLTIKDMSRVVMTPHIGWATVEARIRCAEEVLENIKAYLRGEERNVCR